MSLSSVPTIFELVHMTNYDVSISAFSYLMIDPTLS